MDIEKHIDLYSAIAMMRMLTAEQKPFDLEFVSYSMSKDTSGGRKRIPRCLLRKSSNTNKVSNSDIMLNLFDVDTRENKSCYQIAILKFNSFKVIVQ